MIKDLYEEKKIEEAEFEGDFSEGVKESVKALIDENNNHTRDFLGKRMKRVEKCRKRIF